MKQIGIRFENPNRNNDISIMFCVNWDMPYIPNIGHEIQFILDIFDVTDEVYKTLIQDEILNFNPQYSKLQVEDMLHDMEFIVTRIFWEKLDSTLTFAPVLILKDISQ